MKAIMIGGVLGLSLLTASQAGAEDAFKAGVCKLQGKKASLAIAYKKAGGSLVEALRYFSAPGEDWHHADWRIRLMLPLFYQYHFTEEQAARAVEINCLQTEMFD